VALVPLLVWCAVVVARPGDLPLDRTAWWTVGLASVGLASGVAALASRRGVPSPGSVLASVLALAVLSPVVVTAFLGWGSVYPVSDVASGVWAFWGVVGAGGVVAWVLAARPGLRT
jgi:hypothetical protein